MNFALFGTKHVVHTKSNEMIPSVLSDYEISKVNYILHVILMVYDSRKDLFHKRVFQQFYQISEMNSFVISRHLKYIEFHSYLFKRSGKR